MIQLVKIGNSQGIRIPKPLIEQAQLIGKDLTLEIVDGGLFLAPVKTVRAGWQDAIAETMANYKATPQDDDWLNAELTNDDDLEW